MGHEGDELCSYEDIGVRLAIRKLSVRWHIRWPPSADRNGNTESDEDDLHYKRSSLWSPKTWCSKSILETRMAL